MLLLSSVCLRVVVVDGVSCAGIDVGIRDRVCILSDECVGCVVVAAGVIDDYDNGGYAVVCVGVGVDMIGVTMLPGVMMVLLWVC